MTPSQRAEAERIHRQLVAATTTTREPDAQKQRLAVIAKMLLAYPMAGASAETGKARAEAYLEALDDLPPWAVADAVTRWHRGQCGDDFDYRWAPAPAVLRKIALAQIAPLTEAAAHVAGLLAAVPIDEALRSERAEQDRAYVTAGFERLKFELQNGPRQRAAQQAAAE